VSGIVDSPVAETDRTHAAGRNLWPNTFVSESSLARLAAEARAALADDARKALYVRTVFGFGYAFCAEAVEERPRAASGLACRLSIGPRDVPLHPGENILGLAFWDVVGLV
jgi:hypothetical protein